MALLDDLKDVCLMSIDFKCPQYTLMEAWHVTGKKCWFVFKKLRPGRLFFDRQMALEYGRR
jgi:hypothetical protein